MAFRVEIAPRAFANLDEITTYIMKHESHEQAQMWFEGIIEAIASGTGPGGDWARKSCNN